MTNLLLPKVVTAGASCGLLTFSMLRTEHTLMVAVLVFVGAGAGIYLRGTKEPIEKRAIKILVGTIIGLASYFLVYNTYCKELAYVGCTVSFLSTFSPEVLKRKALEKIDKQ